MKNETKYFVNDGFGWVCKACSSETAADPSNRLMSEGESESKSTRLSAPLAKWTDDKRDALMCGVCEVSETVVN